MEKGILYGVGVGPGDPELLTLKAVRLLQEADLIAVPDKGTGSSTALQIIGAHGAGKPLLFCPTPMTRDRSQWDACHEQIADRICAALDEGKKVVFITLGDPTVYSTYIYIHKKVAARGYRAELVPGVTSFCATAAKLGQPLCENDQRLLIVPASCDLQDSLDIRASKVFMKAGSCIMELQQALDESGDLERASLAENIGLEGERLLPHFGALTAPSGYFSVVLVPEKE